MGKFIILLLIFLLGIYVFTGRFAVVKSNISERGVIALNDEPAWISNFIAKKWKVIFDAINDFIDSKELKSTKVNREVLNMANEKL